MIKQIDVDRAITDFIETRPRKPLVALVHPAVAQHPARDRPFMFYRGVCFYSDDRVPVCDDTGTVLFLLGDCIDPAIAIRNL